MSMPAVAPLGLRLARTGHTVTQALERALAQEGGSVPVWQVLLLVHAQRWGTQSEMAEEIGITGATLTHHLNALEARGLIRRWRQAGNRRAQHVELTDDGLELFERLRSVAARHDRELQSQLSDSDERQLRELLDRLESAVRPGR
jgi:MarR family transcriptional regulator for hemolysin